MVELAGPIRCSGRLVGAATLALLLLLGRSAGAEAFLVEGKVKVTAGDGGLPSSLIVGATRDGQARPLGRIEIAKDGSFLGRCPAVSPEEKLQLYPSNDAAFIDAGKQFLLGALRLDGKKGRGLSLDLKALPMETIVLEVVKADSAPLTNTTLSCRWALTGPNPECPEAEYEWRAESDARGAARIRIPRGIDAACTFSVRIKNEHGDWDQATLRATSADLLKEHGPHAWKLPARQLALEVSVQWDPAFSKEPFLWLFPAAHNVRLEDRAGAELAEVPLDARNSARFYDLPRGTYTVRPGEVLARHYRATDGGSVTIGDGTELPVRQTLVLMPQDPAGTRAALAEAKALLPENLITREGMLLDASSDKPVVGAEVASRVEKVRTDSLGRFKIKSVNDPAVRLSISHPEYYSLEIPLPGDQGLTVDKFKVKPCPVFSGRVLFDQTRKPAGRCEFFLQAPGHDRVRLDGFGRFSLRARPGEYMLEISAPVDLEEFAEFPFGDEQLAVVYCELLEIPTAGLQKDFRVPGVARVVITPGIEPAAQSVDRLSYVGLVRAADNTEIGVRRPAYVGKALSFYVGAGKYRVMALGAESRVAFVAEVEAEAGKTVKVTATAKKWTHYYGCDRQGRVELLDRPRADTPSIRDTLKPGPIPLPR